MKYTPEEEKLIDEQGRALLEASRDIARSEADRELIRKAFNFAKNAHEGVRRKSGEPYITHPIAVARIVVDEIGLGVKSVVAALIHDVVEDTDYTLTEIEQLFGPKIASMVDGLTKIDSVFAGGEHDESSLQAENFRKMLLTLSDDVRVILIKIADRLHNMRTLGPMPMHKQVKIISETVYLFAPLAHRLGLYAIKTELEDLSLRYRFPEEYRAIEEKLQATDAERQQYIERFNTPIVEALRAAGIEFDISGRVKSIYSIWKKMQKKGVPFEEVYDIFAIRIVFKPTPLIPEKSQCWHIYSLITDVYKPKPDRIRDWVNIPKANGYEALHCTVMGPDGEWVEVQIRSERMEAIAERGFAAHWKYKGGQQGEGELDKWIRQIRQALSGPTESAVEFLDNFKMSLYTSEVVVFTPRGEQRILPQGATALDFAYEIHSKIGNSAVGARINHAMVSIFTPITSGDQIEIITSGNVVPRPEWLEHVATAKARTSIKNFLNRDRQNNIERGIAIFDEKMRAFGIQPSARVFRKLLPAYRAKTKDEFYNKLGTGAIHLDGVEKILRQNAASKIIKYWSLQFPNPFRSNKKRAPEAAKGSDEAEIRYTIADCCNPIPGDRVVGYQDEVDHITVHKKSCPELVALAATHGERVVEAQWSGVKAVSYLSVIEIRGIDRIGVTLDIAKVISEELHTNMREFRLQSHDGIFEGELSVYVPDTDALKTLIGQLEKIRGVEHVHRVERVEN